MKHRPGHSGRHLVRAAVFAVAMLVGLVARADDDVEARGRARPVAEALERLIARELADKSLPALSICLVDGDQIIWARGFGLADPARGVPASAATVYRVGSVSKLFTDLAVMRLVERGELDLDAPASRALPGFSPRNPFDRPITLRQLMAHRSGLVREPPVGHYFDPTRPSLAETVRSLNDTALVYEPETHTKYSNAAIAAVGYLLERKAGEPFADHLKRSVLDPMGLDSTSFEPPPELEARLARGVMWTYDGRTFAAPTWPLGTGPAGNLASTVADLGRFLSVLFAGGKGPGGPVVKPETLDAMMTPQLAQPGERKPPPFGLGFMLDRLDGRRRVGHGGSVYGFATELAALPDDRLGVAVVTTRDCANAVSRQVADVALRLMLAAKEGRPLPAVEPSGPVAADLLGRLPGRYGNARKGIDLFRREGKLFLLPRQGGVQAELRQASAGLIVDDALAHGQALKPGPNPDHVTYEGEPLDRVAVGRPDPAPGRWKDLIGEYGWDHNTLYILEKDGRLHALIEWFFLYPLEEESANVFRFPATGLYDGETLVFTRDDRGRVSGVVAGGVAFPRRPIDGEDGATFRIKPVRPLDALRAEAAQARPPVEPGKFREPDLVELTTLDPTIKLDIRYASTHNVLSTPFYTSARAFLQRPVAEALVRAHRQLEAKGYGLLIHDAYRPWSVTRMFWDATPEASRIFVADPARGSRHNRGAAVDLTLYERATGRAVEMVGGYDEFSNRSRPHYPGGTSLQRWHRDLLRSTLEAQGFTVNEVEWWHFDDRHWNAYPILNVPFEQLEQKPNGAPR